VDDFEQIVLAARNRPGGQQNYSQVRGERA
jgi:hypothetical protein